MVFTDDRSAPSADTLYPVGGQSGHQFARRIGGLLSMFLRQRAACVQRLKSAGRLLDFGCGNGAFALHMRTAGYDVVGIEPFSLGETVKSERLELVRAPWDQVKDRLGVFDVITLWQVLEHLDRPVDMLKRLAPHLAPDGVMIVSVPNFSSVQSAAFGGGWFHLDPPRHVSHFEPATLERCLRLSGLTPVSRTDFLPEYGCSGWVQSSLNAVLPHTNYLYELVKDRGALRGMSAASSMAHLAASLALAPALLALSLPIEALASARGKGATLTWAARRSL